MSAWDVHGAADTALLSWSSVRFDELMWDEFGENDDHIVPETEALTKSVQTLKDEAYRKTKNEFPVLSGTFLHQNFQKLSKSYSGLESMEEPISDLNNQQANLPSQEKTNSVSGISSVNISNTRNRSDCLNSLSIGSDGVLKKGSKACKFESTNSEFEDSDYQDNGADMPEASYPFLPSEICPHAGGFEFFGVPEEGKGGNLLEYGWGNNNLEDIDKLFLNDDPLVPQAFDDDSDGMLWESSSTVVGSGSIYKSTLCPESRALKGGDLKGLQTRMDFVPCEIPMISSTTTEVGAGAKGQSLPCSGMLCSAVNLEKQTEHCIGQSINDIERPPAPMEGVSIYSKKMEDDGLDSPKEAEKVSKAKRHSARCKRIEERSRKHAFEGKSAMSSYNYLQADNPQLQCRPFRIRPPSSSSQDFPTSLIPQSQVLQSSASEPRSSRQYPQPVQYVHAGFGFPVHHMPIMISGTSAMPQQLQHAQPVFSSYQPLVLDASKSQNLRNIYESHHLIGSSTMTPQEKIEKLRWRQKMQAQLAVEHQQQKLINQHVILDSKQLHKQQQLQTSVKLRCSQNATSQPIMLASEPLVWNEGSVNKLESLKEEGDDSLAATVLQQMIDIASELDTRTRLCLRDGFHRLAASAMQRRAAADGRSSSGSSGEPHNGTCGQESSSSSEQSSCNRRIWTVADIVETETNPIDRFIAHLLFHKRSPSTLVPLNTSPNSCTGNSQEVLFHQSPWALQTKLPPIEVYPAAVPSVVKCGSSVLQGSAESPHVIMDVPECNSRQSGTSACLSSTNLKESSPVPPKAVSSGLAEGSIADGSKEASPDRLNFFSCKSMNSTKRSHTSYNHYEGAIGTFSQVCMQHQEATDDKSPSSDLSMDKHLLCDQKGPLTSAALNSANMHPLPSRDPQPSDISLRCSIKEDVEMIGVDVVPSATALHVEVATKEMVLEPHVREKRAIQSWHLSR